VRRTLILVCGLLLFTGGTVWWLYPEQPSKAITAPTFHFELTPLNSDLFLTPDPFEEEFDGLQDMIDAEEEKKAILEEMIEIQKELNKLYELEQLRRAGKLWSA